MKISWDYLDNRSLPDWYTNAKFGIFIHWGPYSVPAYKTVVDKQFGSYAEWYYSTVYGNYGDDKDSFHKKVYGNKEYREFGYDFKAELFDPDSFAEIIKNSGARYAVLTSKHHDGFCLWKTDNVHKVNWNSADIGPHRDLVKELSESIRKKSIKFGLYYSIIDWESVPSHRCDGRYFIPMKDVKKYGLSKEVYLKEVLQKQLYEIVNKFKPSLIFADGGEWDLTEDEVKIREFLYWLYNKSPVKDEVVVNDRFYKGMEGKHGDYFSTEYNDKVLEDHHIFEESRGIGKSYGYNRLEKLEDYLTSQEIIKKLYKTVSKGGNFLLNIGPRADGQIPTLQVERLKEVGRWLEFCGEAIFNTKANFKFINSTTNEEFNYYFINPQKENEFKIENKFLKEIGNNVDVLGVENNCKISDGKLLINNKYEYYNQIINYDVIVLRKNKKE